MATTSSCPGQTPVRVYVDEPPADTVNLSDIGVLVPRLNDVGKLDPSTLPDGIGAGAQGPQGPQGIAGADGKTMRSGDGPPNLSIGNIGD